MTLTLSKSDLIALAPCPFCGCEPVVRLLNDGQQIICCEGEECFGPRTTAYTMQDATVQWNTRHPASQPSLYEAGLRDMRERAKRSALAFNPVGKLKHRGTCEGIAAAIAALPADSGETEQSNSDADWQRLLNSRDNFIVKKGLWSEFVESLPGPSEATPSTAGSVREASPDDLRALGWTVACHNDYRLNGVAHTFWLLTKDERAIKGEGRSDAAALNAIRAALSPPVEAPVAWTPELEAARIELCEYWIKIADDHHEGATRNLELGRKAIETEAALTILGEFANATPRPLPSVDEASQALKAMEDSCWSLRCEDAPTGAGDADVVWHVVSHHMAKPHDRVEGVGNTPLAALQAALLGGSAR